MKSRSRIRRILSLLILFWFASLTSLASVGNAQNSAFPYEYPGLGYFPPDVRYTQQGYRLGHIVKLNKEGLAVWRYRWEGQLMQGFGTDQGPMLDNECLISTVQELTQGTSQITEEEANLVAAQECLIATNPWSFSFFRDGVAERYSSFMAGAVVVYYERPLIAPQSVLSDTKNYVRGIWPVNPNLPIESSITINRSDLPVSSHFTPVQGTVEGRVVAAVLNDPLRKTYEIILQLGPDGNNFRTLSLNNGDVFDYIVRAMFTGQLLRINFVQLIAFQRPLSTLRGYDTSFYITGVTLLEEAPGLFDQ